MADEETVDETPEAEAEVPTPPPAPVVRTRPGKVVPPLTGVAKMKADRYAAVMAGTPKA
jgi:hypothetical protein